MTSIHVLGLVFAREGKVGERERKAQMEGVGVRNSLESLESSIFGKLIFLLGIYSREGISFSNEKPWVTASLDA